MKREHMNAVVRFAALTDKLDRLAEQLAATAAERAALVARLCSDPELSLPDVAALLGVSQTRVTQLLATHAKATGAAS